MSHRDKSSHRRSGWAFCALALAVTVTATSYAASIPLHANRLTFSGTVALPGRILPAGTYVFEVANPDTSANTVRVRSENGQVQYLGFTMRVPRPAGLPRDAVVSIGEGERDAPPPILAWYPIGTSIGHRFMYR